ncbi:MAG: 4-alpha-glucanotransferase [Bacteroidota bacterium]
MTIHFKIHYNTQPGENICISGTTKAFGNWDPIKAFALNYNDGGFWTGTIKLSKNTRRIEYNYILINDNGSILKEWGVTRKMVFSEFQSNTIYTHEFWRAPANEEKVLYSSAFSKVIFPLKKSGRGNSSKANKSLRFKIDATRVKPRHQICILGNHKYFGNWGGEKPLLLSRKEGSTKWTGSIMLEGLDLPLEYKYGIFDTKTKTIVEIEKGEPRKIQNIPAHEDKFVYLRSDESYRHPTGGWKGSGVAVPVFSIRSKNSFGVGDFSDLKSFIDWAASTGMNMVQILPINETIASHNWLDSYPYKSISVTALHPIYMNVEKMGPLKSKRAQNSFEKRRKVLNEEKFVNYPEVLKLKSEYFKLLFDQEKASFFDNQDYKDFFRSNKDWLVPYAAFAYLRDKYNSPDFRNWGAFSQYDAKKIIKTSSPKSKEWDDIAIHYFIQFHLDKQLKAVTEHSRKKGIVLKGDIPIGISPNSVEAWTEPHLFNLDAQAGAPPDDFAIKGQNWGFPTYNWEAMAKEDYAWWKKRLRKMGEYFDAYRIDHILGFFRIWEIPIHAVEGLLGYFNKALPLTAQEIGYFGVDFDFERMAKPYIRTSTLNTLFAEDATEVVEQFLRQTTKDSFELKPEFDTQLKINQYFLNGIEEEDLTDIDRRIRDGLFELVSNVLFVQTGPDEWHPRIMLQSTSSYAELGDQTKANLMRLYNHFFYQRHDEFWHDEGMKKLPAIMTASDMLVCGEDLGMVPDCVPPVMDKLNILSLEIQRMSKKPEYRFAHPGRAPYLSICTTSTHDMSTIRGWWEDDRELTQNFFNHELGINGSAPYFAEPWVCETIIKQHFDSPAMWVTIPIQDLIAIDGDFRWDETQSEQINHPDNVRHKWRFRMHQSIETLKKAKSLNEKLRQMIEDSGRQ